MKTDAFRLVNVIYMWQEVISIVLYYVQLGTKNSCLLEKLLITWEVSDLLPFRGSHFNVRGEGIKNYDESHIVSCFVRIYSYLAAPKYKQKKIN